MNIKTLLILILALILIKCTDKPEDIQEVTQSKPLTFTLDMANELYRLAFDCIDREYPNKPGGVLGDGSYIMSPREMHPAFYGCFDWHSSVHGHWTLVTILSEFPDFEMRDSIILKLKNNITRDALLAEAEFFNDEHNRTFQRTYGWAWLLKLAEALREWDAPEAKELHSFIEPLELLLAERFIEFLNVLNYPIRVGEHTNTAFGMSFAYDYAVKYHPELAKTIEEKAREYYYDDTACPLSWEPSGFDFLSPCLLEASLMNKVLSAEEFAVWFDSFLPYFAKEPEKYIYPATVPDASDGKLVHLDGLNFSRAWCLFEIGNTLENNNLINAGTEHFNFSYEKLDSGEYMGSHWLASFATYALLKSRW